MANIGIYKIENKVNGKVYIGQSLNIFKRWANHANPRVSPNMVITKAIIKYRVASFTFEVVELCDKSMLNEREKYWINYYNSYKAGYNSTEGGDSREFRKSKIKEETAKEIQIHLQDIKISKVKLAEMYDVAESTIRSINTGDSWVNPDLDYPIRKGYLKNLISLKSSKYLNNPKKILTCIACNVGISSNTRHNLCVKCSWIKARKVIRPTKIELLGKVLHTPNTEIAKFYGVSDNAIKKWCKYYKIPSNFRLYKKLRWSRGEDSNLHMSGILSPSQGDAYPLGYHEED